MKEILRRVVRGFFIGEWRKFVVGQIKRFRFIALGRVNLNGELEKRETLLLVSEDIY
jgi:hypothetical protein